MLSNFLAKSVQDQVLKKTGSEPEDLLNCSSKRRDLVGISSFLTPKLLSKWKYIACFEVSPKEDSPQSTASSRIASNSQLFKGNTPPTQTNGYRCQFNLKSLIKIMNLWWCMLRTTIRIG
jgi:hypothetical protein